MAYQRGSTSNPLGFRPWFSRLGGLGAFDPRARYLTGMGLSVREQEVSDNSDVDLSQRFSRRVPTPISTAQAIIAANGGPVSPAPVITSSENWGSVIAPSGQYIGPYEGPVNPRPWEIRGSNPPKPYPVQNGSSPAPIGAAPVTTTVVTPAGTVLPPVDTSSTPASSTPSTAFGGGIQLPAAVSTWLNAPPETSTITGVPNKYLAIGGAAFLFLMLAGKKGR